MSFLRGLEDLFVFFNSPNVLLLVGSPKFAFQQLLLSLWPTTALEVAQGNS
jgi:hypothetical protein